MTLQPDHPNPMGESSSDAARREAGRVGGEAKDAAKEVVDTARDEAGNVKDEAVRQVKSLAATARDEAYGHASTQQDRLAKQSRIVSDDLQRLSRGEQPESDLVKQALSAVTDRAQRFTHSLENKSPEELLGDVRRFAARRPWTFLAIAAGIGIAAGRLTRGLKDSGDDEPRALTAARREHRDDPEPREVSSPPRNRSISEGYGAAAGQEAEHFVDHDAHGENYPSDRHRGREFPDSGLGTITQAQERMSPEQQRLLDDRAESLPPAEGRGIDMNDPQERP